MSLPYKEEFISSPDGITCKVLDTDRIDFSAASEGRKVAVTLVRCATGGERIETKNSEGRIESVCVTKPGDAIFINLNNLDDIYVPGDADGSRWQFKDLAKKGYEIVGEDQEKGGVLVKRAKTEKILHEIIQQPSCIKNAWGEGQHQFVFPGATLKKDDKGKVTSIDKEAFDATWEITSKPPAVVPRSAGSAKIRPK